MNKELFEYVKSLSLKDKKSLSQKVLKVQEELGELSRVALPLENADGTTHRFVESEKVLEECVDIMLAAISIAYAEGYSDEEIEDVMRNKSEKWHGLQVKEDKVEYPIPYEIHVTVKLAPEENTYNHQINMFKKTCDRAGVKPIVLDLENSGEVVMKDVMTSSHHIGDNASAYAECKRISKDLERNGFLVVREKIETVPWHPAAPQDCPDKMPKDCYFEAHIGCIITPEQKDELSQIAEELGCHLSRNFFKKHKDGRFVNMLTIRAYSLYYASFEEDVEYVKEVLRKNDIDFEKVITEFSIYDTKVSHDFLWLDKGSERQETSTNLVVKEAVSEVSGNVRTPKFVREKNSKN